MFEIMTWSGRFFVTAQGRLGIGPEATKPGDQIAVFQGARSPFVIRLLDGGDFALDGDAFVLGLMHGEVRDMCERGEVRAERIVLQCSQERQILVVALLCDCAGGESRRAQACEQSPSTTLSPHLHLDDRGLGKTIVRRCSSGAANPPRIFCRDSQQHLVGQTSKL